MSLECALWWPLHQVVLWLCCTSALALRVFFLCFLIFLWRSICYHEKIRQIPRVVEINFTWSTQPEAAYAKYVGFDPSHIRYRSMSYANYVVVCLSRTYDQYRVVALMVVAARLSVFVFNNKIANYYKRYSCRLTLEVSYITRGGDLTRKVSTCKARGDVFNSRAWNLPFDGGEFLRKYVCTTLGTCKLTPG